MIRVLWPLPSLNQDCENSSFASMENLLLNDRPRAEAAPTARLLPRYKDRKGGMYYF
jgi:hypothetical protein